MQMADWPGLVVAAAWSASEEDNAKHTEIVRQCAIPSLKSDSIILLRDKKEGHDGNCCCNLGTVGDSEIAPVPQSPAAPAWTPPTRSACHLAHTAPIPRLPPANTKNAKITLQCLTMLSHSESRTRILSAFAPRLVQQLVQGAG